MSFDKKILFSQEKNGSIFVKMMPKIEDKFVFGDKEKKRRKENSIGNVVFTFHESEIYFSVDFNG